MTLPDRRLILISRRTLRVFRRPRNASDDLEDGRVLVPPIVARFGLVLSEVRLVSVSSSLRAWVIPGARGASLLHRGRTRDGSYSMGGWGGPVESVAKPRCWPRTFGDWRFGRRPPLLPPQSTHALCDRRH